MSYSGFDSTSNARSKSSREKRAARSLSRSRSVSAAISGSKTREGSTDSTSRSPTTPDNSLTTSRKSTRRAPPPPRGTHRQPQQLPPPPRQPPAPEPQIVAELDRASGQLKGGRRGLICDSGHDVEDQVAPDQPEHRRHVISRDPLAGEGDHLIEGALGVA